MRIKVSDTTQKVFFMAYDSSDYVTAKTGLSGFTVYYSLNGGAATAMTTPTVAELDSTNMKGLYALTIDEAGMVSSMGELVVYPAASNGYMSPKTVEIVDNFEKDSYDIVNNGTYGNSALKTEIDANETKIDALNNPSSSAIADAVLDEIVTDHIITNSLGHVIGVTEQKAGGGGGKAIYYDEIWSATDLKKLFKLLDSMKKGIEKNRNVDVRVGIKDMHESINDIEKKISKISSPLHDKLSLESKEIKRLIVEGSESNKLISDSLNSSLGSKVDKSIKKSEQVFGTNVKALVNKLEEYDTSFHELAERVVMLSDNVKYASLIQSKTVDPEKLEEIMDGISKSGEFYSISKSLDKNPSLNERKFNDIKDIRSYSPSELNMETLSDDYRIILGWYCNKTSGKKVNASFEEILNVLRLIIVELIKRGKTFNVKRLTPCSQEAFKKAVSKDFPKGIKVPLSDTDYDGIYLPKPHSKLIAQKKKTHVLKSEDFTNAFKQPLYFLDEDFIYGYVLLSKPEKVSLEEAMKRQKEHFVTKADIKKWNWEDKDFLYISKVKKLKLWDRPVSFDIPKGIKTFITFRKLYPFLRKVKRIDTLNVRPSGKTQGKEITLNDILKPLSQAVMEKEDFITLTGAVVNQGKTVNDLDIVIRKPKPDDQRDDTGFKFRIYRGLDKEVGDRIHWLYDTFNGSMTSHIGLYNRWLIPSSVPIKEIESLVDKYPLQSAIHKMSDSLNPDSDKIKEAHEKLHKREGGNE